MMTEDELLSSLYSADELLTMHRSGDEETLNKLLTEYGLRTSSILIRST
jgi:preprotein translocase subunit Sec63